MTDPRARGVDVSSWQGVVDWPLVAAAGFAFAGVRISHGVTLDGYGCANLGGARRAGLRVFGYHYLERSTDPTEQAAVFHDALGGDVAALPARLLPFLDVEEGGADVADRALAFLDAFVALTGIRCGIYTTPNFAAVHSFAAHPELAASPLWIAAWRLTEPPVPAPWTAWTIWQQTARLLVPGVHGWDDGDIAAGELPEA